MAPVGTEPPAPPGHVLQIQLNRTIWTVCGLGYLLYKHCAVSPYMTYVTSWIYGGHSSLFNLFTEGEWSSWIRALHWILDSQADFHSPEGWQTVEGETGCKSLNAGRSKVSGVPISSQHITEIRRVRLWVCRRVIMSGMWGFWCSLFLTPVILLTVSQNFHEPRTKSVCYTVKHSGLMVVQRKH